MSSYAASSHGYPLNVVGGHVPVSPHFNPELAAAAVSPTEAVIQVGGQSHIVHMQDINPEHFELACDDHGCALVPDDGNPHNDLVFHN